ncbi:MAG: DUF3000 domain-containing protein [Propionibacteriaceae bacterium]|jgi:hypothetical protein|uniref:DUF3000 domain-containing protein n=2 Tax=Brooklawnia propionicigenes TaxID=3041175 RepID=A0AAN0K5S4_9ACTN|nr:DUF3000 domain-containing protein [Propionibacteriaceae bacterium]NLI84727.1 DUF3000 domain-containing protein [Propionibacterium sp.]BEH00916.1 DUF3000 domain-containing protein [Brooklawnia sp. SH051]
MSGDSSFGRITDAIEAFGWHPRVQVEQIPAPQRIAPHAYAVEASVLTTADDEVGTGRLIVLHDPNGNQAWNGNYRCVSYARADVDLEMVTDPLLAEVGWTWLTEALEANNASYHDASGTVTAVSSRSFGELAGEADRAEIEIRASWTPELGELPDIVPHLAAWQSLLCTTAGLPPLADGIIQLTTRLEQQ